MKLSMKLKNVKIYMHSIRVVNEWNRLTEDMANVDSIHKFKRYDRECSRNGAPQV